MAKPLPGAKESINRLFEEGHIVIIYSARSWQEFEMTANWLKQNEFQYHQLIMGKPAGDYWIDDRAIKFDNWKAVIDKIL